MNVKNKCSLFLLLVVVLVQHTYAQSSFQMATLKGKITDEKTKKPLEFATISIYNQNDSLVSGAITDAMGDFSITKIPFGIYYAKLTFMGYITRKIDSIHLKPDAPFKALGNLSLQANAQAQEEVEVIAEKSILQLGLDKKVFNVEKSDLANAENATEVLRGTPSVQVDKDEEIKVRGKVVQVYMNGKPTGLTGENQAAVLRQIPANNIKKIEIITNPSAKHAPDGGSSGIINIVMKKNTLEGITGSVRVGTGTNARAWKANGKGYLFNKHNGRVSLNYKNEKVNIFSNISVRRRGSFSNSQSSNHNFLADSSYYFNTTSEGTNQRNSLWGRLGMDYYINDMHTLSFQIRASPSRSLGDTYLYYDNFDKDSILSGSDERSSSRMNRGNNSTYNLIYTILFPEKDSVGNLIKDNLGSMGENRELTFDIQMTQDADLYNNFFNEYHLNSLGEPRTVFPDSQYTTNDKKTREIWAKVDYTHPFKDKKRKIEIGYHFRSRLDQSDFNFYHYNFNIRQAVNSANRSNLFKYTQQIHALYSTYTQKIGKKWNAKLGLRLEQAWVNSILKNTNETFPWNYLQLFPSLHLSYQINTTQQVTLSYSRRVDRPSIWSVNPFPSFDNPRLLWYGNPYLKPSYTNSLEVNYGNYIGMNTISVGLFANYENNQSTNIRAINEEGIITSTPQNLAYNYQLGMDLSSNLRFSKWLSLNLSSSLSRDRYNASAVDSSFNYVSYNVSGNLYMNARFKFGLSISLGGSVWYQNRYIQGKTVPNIWHWCSISQQLINKKMYLSCWMQNPFYNNKYSYSTQTADFNSYHTSMWENRVVNFAINYNFGKVNVKNKKRSKLQGRTGGGGQSSGQGRGR